MRSARCRAASPMTARKAIITTIGNVYRRARRFDIAGTKILGRRRADGFRGRHCRSERAWEQCQIVLPTPAGVNFRRGDQDGGTRITRTTLTKLLPAPAQDLVAVFTVAASHARPKYLWDRQSLPRASSCAAHRRRIWGDIYGGASTSYQRVCAAAPGHQF